MITNRPRPLFRERINQFFSTFLLLFLSTSFFSVNAANYATVKAFAGEDVTAGLCGIKVLDGTLSEGDNITAKWKMLSGPLTVNYSPASANKLFVMFQAYEGGEYQFELTVTDENNNIDKDTIVFNFMALKAEVSDDITIGGCRSVVLDATKNSTLGDGYEYEWYDPNKLSDSSPKPTFTPSYSDFNQKIKFYFTVRDSFGCEAVDEFDITVKDVPVAAINNNIIELSCDSVQLDATWSDGYNATYNWFPENEFKVKSDNPKLATFSNSVPTVKLVLEDELGCKDSTSINLGNKQFLLDAGPDIETSTCINKIIRADVSENLEITWESSPLISSSLKAEFVRIRASDIRTYLGTDTTKVFPLIIKGERLDGCVKRDTTYFTATNTAYLLSAGPNLDAGVCGIQLKSSVDTNYFNSYKWTGVAFNLSENQSQINEITPFVTFGTQLANTFQILTFRGTDIFGCSRNDFTRVRVYNPPSIRATPDSYITNGCKAVQLSTSTSNIDSIVWSPGILFNDSTIANPLYIGSEAKTITVKAYDQFGCEATDDVTLSLNLLSADAGSDKTTTQYAPAWLGSGLSETGYYSNWKLAENYPNVSIEHNDSAFCKFTSTEIGNYKVYLSFTDSVECNLIDSVEIVVNKGSALPIIETISIDTTFIFGGDSIEFDFTFSDLDGGTHTVKWMIEDSSYYTQTAKAQVFNSGWAVASVSDAYTTTLDSIYYTIKPRNPVIINSITTNKDTIYVNETVGLLVNAVSEYNTTLEYTWLISGKLLGIQNPTIVLDQEKWAVVSVTDGYTITKDSIYLAFTSEKLVEPYTIKLSPYDTACYNSQISVSVIPQGEEKQRLNAELSFPDGSTYNGFETNYTVSTSGWIKANVFNTQHERMDSIYVTAIEGQNIQLATKYVCPDDFLQFTSIFDSPVSGDYTFWKDDEAVQISNPVRINTEEYGEYTISATNIYGCSDTAFVTVDVATLPVAVDEFLDIESENQSGILDVSENDTLTNATYSLSDLPNWGNVFLSADGVLTYENTSILFMAKDTLVYLITSNACPNLIDTGNVFVKINNAPILAEDNINGFSPNGDNINDFFVINNIQFYPKNELFIYDKQGNLVFYKKNYDNLWDGKRNRGVGAGNKLPFGTYFYLLKADGLKILNGFVELRR